MVRTSSSQLYRQSSQAQIIQRQSQTDEDSFSVLDDSILDSDTITMSPAMHQRRESLTDSSRVFSPAEGTWPSYQYSAENTNIQSSDHAMNHLVEPGCNTFVRPDASQNIGYPNHSTAWTMGGPSGSCTPTAGFESMSSDFTNSVLPTYVHVVPHASPPNTYAGPHTHAAPIFQSKAAPPMSPQSSKDWTSISSSEQMGEWPPQQARSHSPFHPANLHLFRREGIRKKNARFEIPAERNLRTIDHLINQTNDEQEIKELKQQKRLLRNRQAALDSRQRKKQHTERLEEEKKHFTSIITDLEEALGEMKIRETEWLREKENWAVTQQQYKQYVDNLILEKEEIVRCHTIESGELRKKNSFLIDQIHKLESTAMSTAPSSTGFSADFSDFDHITMHSSPWENFSVVNDFSIETEPQTDTPVALPFNQAKPTIKEDDKTAASGFLLLLLLCGAWVASRSSQTAVNLPQMPEDMRVASAAVLDHIYQDAGIPPQPNSGASTYEAQAAKMPQPHDRRKTTLTAFEIASLSKSPLDSLHHHLTAPTEDQLRDQVFSLTASQYNSISGDTNYDSPKKSPKRNRRNLEQTLIAVRSRSDAGATDVYTRSLMWDRVPREVVRDFARMVSETSAVDQWKSEPV